MSESDTSRSPLFDKSRRPYLLRKLHSLTGVLPVGGFLCFHLWENSRAMYGQDQFDEAVAGIGHMPFLPVLEAVILLPLLFHAGYGIKLALESRGNVNKYPYSRNWMYTAQRVTGMIAFLFIAFHLYEYWGHRVTGKLASEQFYPALCQNMSYQVAHVPVVGLVYAIGIMASVFHFANGLFGFCFSWGITVSRRSQRLAATVFGLVGVGVLILGLCTVIFFATGLNIPGTLFGSPIKGRTCTDLPAAPVTMGPQAAPNPRAPSAPKVSALP